MLDPNCIFCGITQGKIPCTKELETDRILAFRDLHPQAPVHVLIIPKTHVESVRSITPEHGPVFQELFEAAQVLARKLAISKDGFRTVFNTGGHACQSVFHLHLHLLGGEQMGGSMVG